MRFEWASRTDAGRVRDQNEDAVWPTDDGLTEDVLAVAIADGMGGHAGGEIASATALDTAMTVGGDPTVRVQAANLAVIDAARQRPRLSRMGTTLTLGVLDPDGDMDLGHVGDSRAYLLRDGTLEQLTRDHSYVADLVAAGKLTPEEAETHPYRSVLTRAVGLDPSVEVDTYAVVVQPGDRIMLCSDGLTSMVSDPEISALLGAESSPAATADALVAAANDAGGIDNTTVIVIDVAE